MEIKRATSFANGDTIGEHRPLVVLRIRQVEDVLRFGMSRSSSAPEAEEREGVEVDHGERAEGSVGRWGGGAAMHLRSQSRSRLQSGGSGLGLSGMGLGLREMGANVTAGGRG